MTGRDGFINAKRIFGAAALLLAGGGLGSTICGLSTSQLAYCWGDDTYGELGDGKSGAANDSGSPVAVLKIP